MSPPNAPDPSRAAGGHALSDVPARDPHFQRVVTTVLVVAVAGVLAALLVLAVDIFLAAFGGLLFAILLRAATDLLAKYTPVPTRWAYGVLLASLAVLLVAGGALLMPFAQEQAQRATEQLPQIVSDVEQFLEEREWGRWILQRAEEGGAEGALEATVGAASGVLGTLTNWFYYFLTAFFVGLFAAARPSLYVDGTVRLFPLAHRDRAREMLDELGHTLRWWLVGQLLAMLLIGVSTAIVLLLFGVRLAIPLGVVVGLLGFIPYIGPIIGLVPVGIVAGTEGVEILFYVLGTYMLVQLIEGYVITPMIQHRMVYLPPVFTIVTQIVLGTLLGVIGFVLATPLAAVVLVLSRFYREDVLGEPRAVERGREG
jgi:predicted PurR-regulated permease PerM